MVMILLYFCVAGEKLSKAASLLSSVLLPLAFELQLVAQ